MLTYWSYTSFYS